MESFGANPTFTINQQTIEHIGDLEWFEGTLIALFRDVKTGQLLVLHWLDMSKNFHRWLLFPVTPWGIKLYLDKKLSNEDLFWLVNPEMVRIVELNGDMTTGKVEEVKPSQLPKQQRPSPEGFFDPYSCPNVGIIIAELKKYPALMPIAA